LASLLHGTGNLVASAGCAAIDQDIMRVSRAAVFDPDGIAKACGEKSNFVHICGGLCE
jgi:hypothetical protein